MQNDLHGVCFLAAKSARLSFYICLLNQLEMMPPLGGPPAPGNTPLPGQGAGDDDAGRFLAAVFFGFFDHLINGVFDGLGKFFYGFPKRSGFKGRRDWQRSHLRNDLRGADVLSRTADVVCAIGVDGNQASNCGDAQIGDGILPDRGSVDQPESDRVATGRP